MTLCFYDSMYDSILLHEWNSSLYVKKVHDKKYLLSNLQLLRVIIGENTVMSRETTIWIVTQLLHNSVFVICMQNYHFRGKSYQPIRNDANTSYRDFDNFPYHKNRVQ